MWSCLLGMGMDGYSRRQWSWYGVSRASTDLPEEHYQVWKSFAKGFYNRGTMLTYQGPWQKHGTVWWAVETLKDFCSRSLSLQ
jgi:hypothetical protein